MTLLKSLTAIAALSLTASFAAATTIIDCVPTTPLANPVVLGERNLTAIENVVVSRDGFEMKTRYINTRYTSAENSGVEQRSTDLLVAAGQRSNIMTFVPVNTSVFDLHAIAFTLLETKSLKEFTNEIPVGNYPVEGAFAIYAKEEANAIPETARVAIKPTAVINLACLYKVSR